MDNPSSFSNITPLPGDPRSSSRYELLVKIASGGVATVYAGRLRSAAGFSRLVAIKCAHPHLVQDGSLKQTLITEARLASQIHHPNVVAVQDVEEIEGELRLVMDYVEGAALVDLVKKSAASARPPPTRLAVRIAIRIALDACAGLHAAHELTDDLGAPLGIVHRDVSPHNILVGLNGVSRLSDFGIAKGTHSGANTVTGALKGKIAYMAPEYIRSGVVNAAIDVFGLGVVVWELIANQRLFQGNSQVDTLNRVVKQEAPLLSTIAPWVGTQFDEVLAAALSKSPEQRYQSAADFGAALEEAARWSDLIGSHAEVGAYVRTLVGGEIEQRRAQIRSTSQAPPEALTPLPGTTNPALQAAVRAATQQELASEGRARPPAYASAQSSKPGPSERPRRDPPQVSHAALPTLPTLPTSPREENALGGPTRSSLPLAPTEQSIASSSPSPRRGRLVLVAVGLLVFGLIAIFALRLRSTGAGSSSLPPTPAPPTETEASTPAPPALSSVPTAAPTVAPTAASARSSTASSAPPPAASTAAPRAPIRRGGRPRGRNFGRDASPSLHPSSHAAPSKGPYRNP